MSTATHNDVVLEQYDTRASAYLTSAVHAAGPDLDAMAALVGQRADAAALDVGCGGGHVTFTLAPRVGRMVACDLSTTMLATVAAEAAKRGLRNVSTVEAVAEALPGADGAYDIVATRFSAHHWGAFDAGLAQMRRVLKPGGLALFADVVSPSDPLLDTWLQALELLRDPSHVRNASVAQWTAALGRAGFVVDSVATYRLRIEFSSWIARMRTPEAHVAAIRSLQGRAAAQVRDYFELEDDGSFTFDTALIAARPAG